VLFLIDSMLDVSQVDKKLAKFISEQFKPCILVINKWDLAKDRANTADYEQYLGEVLTGLRYAPIAFTTATDGKNIQSVLDLAGELFKQASTQIPTARLNKAIEHISKEHLGGGKKKGGFPKIYYATQVSTKPIALLLFVNRPELFDETFRRFIINQLRQLLSVEEVPLRLLLRSHR